MPGAKANLKANRRLSFLMYALGYLGIAVFTQTTVKWYQFYYAPPEANQFALRALVPISLIGVAMVLARIVDGLADPVVAYYSDRSRHRLGRRIPFILYGSLPLAATFILLWFPPVRGESLLNLVYLAVMLSLFFIFFTVVVAPYLALIGELTRTGQERMAVTTLQGVAQVLGVMIAEAGSGLLIAAWGFPVMGVVLGLFSLLTVLLTPAFVKEELVPPQEAPAVSLVDSVQMTLRNRNFALYLASYLAIWFGINTLTIAMPYITEVLLGKSADHSGYLIAGAFVLALLVSPFLPKVAERYSKKQIMLATSALFALILAATGLFGTLIPYPAAAALVVLAGVPLAVIFVVPNAMVADLAELDGLEHGQRREGMFFGVQGLIMKVVIGLSSLVTPLLFKAFGYSAARPLGLQIAGPLAGAAVLLGLCALSRYDLEEGVLAAKRVARGLN
ncbi:MAG: MFS transporter [Bacillota bacterium]|nr:MFS transporter [Bacillota bacterium]